MFNLKAVLPLAAALLLSVAGAHATVRTETGLSESTAGRSETYRLNVPTEKEMATTQIRLVVPAGVVISRFQVTPGFTRTVKKDAAGLVTEVVWKGRVAPMEYARFFFQAKNPAAAGEVVWKVYQTYSDGSVVAWDDTNPAEGPASRTTVK
ncbi:DUF1775 domain-containing protein [Deinococcus soli (ex Cha et al. 2016)]|uniref:Uncharacterized protein YcnI n=2 Tax=Deinococcus soli (ex Cha et al. 2016) TaxID=1309411 RepID=A0ACC6KBK4_9DEIO|nr:DUF1775 domain-containing protein [Deinococcus soli (ex Cha et al. 2016)]MDR6216806.1 uncharacterized protein YcnI [Deinococcus soli (ex Cha et al. 2016)]MDR6327627.1 uncharacterized protein YcnI [Deinococcus soli (ex Cha et al. 2016)]MDR6749902.1 uncharacterized protein YcnI [Deinococcus soli (ex Cha et al. 2016)]